MGLSFACDKCWDDPCTCGWEYRNNPPKQMVEFIRSTLQYRTKEEARLILRMAIEQIDDPALPWKMPDDSLK